ncbi:hypothetical protein PROH_19635 [Prochlorothrix hollandica PCC 9006 = CALU 1027]|uniref:Putative restriction endonuclease domain-containing protein n=1 Tax=Prochlorothrix hollandica PCC 9006 = CALU 1027 TaxID=317619 RepID=A0A0M2PUN4_PROHO|nr:hypothetical protein PROH_19635 [Prochlorothrix hollandica PCC 9006 = CALU 1027]
MLITDQQPHRLHLPSPEELPCSDDTPVDNEDQNLLPNLLLATLSRIWQHRQDWFFGVDMALYHTTGDNPRIPIVPDAFLSLGVERKKEGKSRRSYAVWAEGGVVPLLALELVSYTARGEYDHKLDIYRQMGVLYYVVYNPEFWQRDHHDPLEVYRLEGGVYQRQTERPFWMPEIGLGIDRHTQTYLGTEQELLMWFDAAQQVYALPEVSREELLGAQRRAERERRRAERERLRAEQERLRAEQERLRAEQEQQRAEQEQQRAEQEQQRAEQERQRATAAEEQTQKLADYLRSLGLDPHNLP